MFSIFIGHQIELWRDRGSMFFVVLFPILMVFILGTMLTSLDNPDEPLVHFNLGYVIDSTNPATLQTAQSTIAQFEDVRQIEFSRYDSSAAAKAALESDELGAAVVFSEPIDIEILEGHSATINRFVRVIFEGVVQMKGAYMAAAAQATAPPAPLNLPNRVAETSSQISRTMIDYYAICMIVMMTFMGSVTAAAIKLWSSRKDGTLRRMLASPLSRTAIYLQTLISFIPQNILQVGIVMIAAPVFLSAHYAASWQDNILLFAMLFVSGFAASAVALLLGILIRFNPWVLLMPVMWVLLFCSGTFSKQVVIEGVTTLMPPFLIQNAAFELTLFANGAPAVIVLLVSLAVIAASAVVGGLLYNGRKVTQ